MWSREELETAFQHYIEVTQESALSGAWKPWAELFTEDVKFYVDNELVWQGRETLREGAIAFFVNPPFDHMRHFLFDWYVIAAIPVAFAASAAVGALMERSVIRWLYGRPLETLLATWGISLILMQLVRSVFGAQNVGVENPSWLSGGWQVLPNLILPYNRLAILAFAALVLAGVALSQIGNVGPDLGQSYIVDSFMVVVLGGVGQLAGTVIAALGLGSIAKFLEPWSGAVLAKIMVLVFIILFIQKRPQGLFALRGRSAEA